MHIEEALQIAEQIADALECAHAHGIVHRDLKPANIKISFDGRVKVLDFGLAKWNEVAPSMDGGSESPTISVAVTRVGVVMGTPAYMSPEQARGLSVDKRTDIWAFGCVLYELLTARRAFEAQTAPDIMVRVLHSEPEWNALPAATPTAITALIRRCLQKDLARRLRDIGDARIEIEEARGQLSLGRGAATHPTIPGAPTQSAQQGFQGSVTRFSISLPPNEYLSLRVGSSVAISPDGKYLVYVGVRSGTSQLYLRPLERFDAKPIGGSEGAEGPFFSPDGQWIGFFADHKLKKVSLQGGTPLPLCGAPVSLGASWNSNDTILFASSPDAGLLRVSAAGGTPQALTVSDSDHGESGHYWPEILPGGSAVLYTAVMSTTPPRIVALRLDTGESKILIEGGTNARYAVPGYLVFAWGPSLMAAPFDAEALRLTGPAVPVFDGVLGTVFAGAQYGISRNGSLTYIPGELQAMNRTMLWVDRNGAAEPVGAPLRPYMDPRISPDGREVVATIHDGSKEDVWSYHFDRGTLTRLTYEGFENETPLWTPQGDKIVLCSSRVGPPMTVFRRPKDGSGTEEMLFPCRHHVHLNCMTSDERVLIFTDYDPIRGGDIWQVELTGECVSRPLLQRPFNEWGAHLSPNGRWITYVSNESGRDEIYVQSFPGFDRKWQVSVEGGTEPLWARNGLELFYRHADSMMAVPVTTEPTFSAEKPVRLFEGRYDRGLTLGHTNYDVAPDAQRFLMLKADDNEAVPTRFNVVLNWFEDLKWGRPQPPSISG